MGKRMHHPFAGKRILEESAFQTADWVKYSFSKEDLEHRGLETTFMRSLTGFWWLEWGGELDTVTDMRQIRTELTHIAYAVWDYIKNRSSLSEELRTYDLDWVSIMPGRRESRRFIGDYIYTQADIDEQRCFPDSVAYGGFGYDDHAKENFPQSIRQYTHLSSGAVRSPLALPLFENRRKPVYRGTQHQRFPCSLVRNPQHVDLPAIRRGGRRCRRGVFERSTYAQASGKPGTYWKDTCVASSCGPHHFQQCLSESGRSCAIR